MRYWNHIFIESKFHGTHDEPFWSNPTGLLKTQNELFEKQYKTIP